MVVKITTERSFFKYTSAATAKIILSNGKLRYSAPPRLNDPFDGQFNLTFGFTRAELTEAMAHRYRAAITSSTPLPGSMTQLFPSLMEAMRANLHRLGMTTDEIIADLRPAMERGADNLERYMPEFHQAVRKLWIADAKIFCVSEVPDQRLMWSHYADEHRGVVIELKAVPKLDNVLCAAHPVQYQDTPPVLASLDEFLDGCFSGHQLDPMIAWEKVFYTKHSDWAYEREWRIVVPSRTADDFTFINLQQEEVASIILGSKIAPLDRQAITEIAATSFPRAKLFKLNLDPERFRMSIDPLS